MEPTENPEKPQTINDVSSAPEVPAQPAQPAAPEPAPAPSVVVSDHSPKKRSKTILAVLVLLLVLAGIGYGAWKVLYPTNSPARQTQATATKKDIPNLAVGVVNGSVKLYTPNNTDGYDQAVLNQIYEGLVTYQDKTKIAPLLATGWSNPNGSTWDFDLRHNVTFHNGHTMTAADVVFSLKEAMKQGEDGAYSSSIKDVKALNDYKVEITTVKPDPFLLNKLTFLDVIDSKEPADSQDTMNATGPYMLKPGSKPSETELQLVAYDKYYGGHVYTRSLTFKSENDLDSAVADYKAGKLNMVGEFSSEHPSQLAGQTYKSLKLSDLSVNFLTVNSVSPGPLQKLEVREALRDSIDIPGLLKANDIAADPASQFVTRDIPGYNPGLAVAKQDTAKAKQLLAQAGYPKGVTLDLYTTPVSTKIGQSIAEQAKAAGITINVKEQTDFDKLIGDMASGKTDLAFLSYSSDTLDAADVFTQVFQQTANFKSSTLDDYLTQASSTTDQVKRLQVLQKTSKYLSDQVAAIPLYSRYRIWVMDKPYVMNRDYLQANPGINFWRVYLNQ